MATSKPAAASSADIRIVVVIVIRETEYRRGRRGTAGRSLQPNQQVLKAGKVR
jgi:hypothetical protein